MDRCRLHLRPIPRFISLMANGTQLQVPTLWCTFKAIKKYFLSISTTFHFFSAYKSKNVILLTVDNKPNPPQIDNGASVTVDTNHPLYIGGYPFTLAKSKGIEGHPQYVGCIRNVEINGRKEQLSSYTPYGNVMFNVCPTIWECYQFKSFSIIYCCTKTDCTFYIVCI